MFPHVRLSLQFITLVSVAGLSACSQLTTSKKELAALQAKADGIAETYVECVKTSAQELYGTTDTAFLVDAARKACASEMDAYKTAMSDYYGAQYMIYDEPLERSVSAVEERAETEATALFVGKSAPVAAASATPTLATPPEVPSDAPATWTAEQRIYLDCMEDQGLRYAGLQEPATSIADVAASRCRSYLTEADRVALEQEGRAVVMGTVMDQRLQTP